MNIKGATTETAKYDYIIVGAGLYGATAARILTDGGSRVLVVEKRDHLGGNAYTVEIDGIMVHRYGPHVFHTNNEDVWAFVNRFADFNSFINKPLAEYDGRLYTLPFNMDTFRQMWGIEQKREAEAIIRSQIRNSGLLDKKPQNLEEQAISMVGTEIYEKLIKGYTEKQWGRNCSELPSSIIKRISVRYDHNDNYFNDKYQGIPVEGYTRMVERMLDGIDTLTGVDFDEPASRTHLEGLASRIVYTGSIDSYYGYCLGKLQYRSLRFEDERIEGHGYFQERAVINYCKSVPDWTRITEHRYFSERDEDNNPGFTIITREYAENWIPGKERMYPIPDERNTVLYNRYRSLAEYDNKVLFGGRLGSYRYYDMDDVIAAAIEDAYKLTHL